MLLAVVLMIVSLAGCGSDKNEALVKKITGTDPETTMMTINGSPFLPNYITIGCPLSAKILLLILPMVFNGIRYFTMT